MPTLATSSQGSSLEINIGGTMTKIPYVMGFTGPNTTQDFEEITNLDSTGGYKEWYATLRDGGTIPFDMVSKANDSAQLYVANANINGSLEHCRINVALTNPASFTFHAFVAKNEYKAETAKVLKQSVELKISGKINIA